MDRQIALAFPTLIGRFHIPGTAKENIEFAQLILAKERSQPGSDFS